MKDKPIEHIIKKIIGERDIKDFTYLILFLLISAFFSFFAIKPALTTAFSLRKEAESLSKTNNLYENIIKRIIVVQGDMQNIRDNIDILNQALPDFPDIKTLIEDLNNKAKAQGFLIEKMQMSPINFKESKGGNILRSYRLTFESKLTYDQLDYLRKTILEDIRLKKIKELTVRKIQMEEASSSAKLQTVITLDVFYL